MNRFTHGTKFYRNAEGGASGGAAPAGGAPASVVVAPSGGSASATVSTSTVGEVAAANADANSAAASVPAVGGKAADAGASPDFKTSLGELANDPALKDVKDAPTLAKMYKDTKSLVGQKLGIPGDDATPEAKAAFHKAMGVPDGIEGYELDKLGDDVPAEVKALFDPEHAKKWAEIFKANNVPASVAKALQAAQIAELGETMKGATEDKTMTDANFDEVATKAFGANKEAALQSARTIIEKHVPQDIREMMAKESNVALIAVASALSGFTKEQTGEDQVINGSNNESTQSEGDLRNQLRAEMSKPEWSNPFAKGKEAHEASKKTANEISKKIADIQAATKKK
jgi:hypothetical protein